METVSVLEKGVRAAVGWRLAGRVVGGGGLFGRRTWMKGSSAIARTRPNSRARATPVPVRADCVSSHTTWTNKPSVSE